MQRFGEAKEELEKVLAHAELRGAALLVFANKQDLPHSAKPAELIEHLSLHTIAGDREWLLQPSNALTGEGLAEGFEWLRVNVKNSL